MCGWKMFSGLDFFLIGSIKMNQWSLPDEYQQFMLYNCIQFFFFLGANSFLIEKNLVQKGTKQF